MIESIVASSPPNPPSGKFSEPRPFILPSLVFFNIANSFIFECSLLYPPLCIHTFLYLLSSLLVVALPSMLCLVSLVTLVCL